MNIHFRLVQSPSGLLRPTPDEAHCSETPRDRGETMHSFLPLFKADPSNIYMYDLIVLLKTYLQIKSCD